MKPETDNQEQYLERGPDRCNCSCNEAVLKLDEVDCTVAAYEVSSIPISDAFVVWTLRYYAGSAIDDDKKVLDLTRAIDHQQKRRLDLAATDILTSTVSVPGALYGEEFKLRTLTLPLGVSPVLFREDSELNKANGQGYCSCGYWGTCCGGWPRRCWPCCKSQTFRRDCISRCAWERLVDRSCGTGCGTLATWVTPCA